MRFLKIIILLLLFEEYQCNDFSTINATHCEYSKKRRIPGKTTREKITFLVGKQIQTKTVLKNAIETKKIVACCPGYKAGPKKSCLPRCDQFCENSICTAPNECTCDAGFTKFSPYRCTPYCENCEKGRCVGPNICECYRGYHKNETDQCVPTCKESCENGFCSEPDVCTCYQGYELDKTNPYKCSPQCESVCIQGKCTAPGVCDCHPGYEFKNGSETECLPICDFCESGNCTGPSKCTCWNNYKEQEIVQGPNIVKVCQPICEDDCINGICIEVDTCSCKNGYEFVKDSFTVCEPVCDPPCQNGICEAPNVCSCDSGYTNIEGQCRAHCANECVNGLCVHPNRCECMDGYQLEFGSTNVCEAFCENCTDGNCVAPNRCECLGGFEMNGNVCERICVEECSLGDCVNGTCVCKDGLRLVNGNCTDDRTPVFEATEDFFETTEDFFGTTEDFDGTTEDIFEGRTENDQFSPSHESGECKGYGSCKPICGNGGCTNGTCISTGICKCFDGFELHESIPFVCVLDNVTTIESAPVKAVASNYISLILAVLIVGLMAVILIALLLNRRNRKVNYNVDEKESKGGVGGEDYVQYNIANKDEHAFA